MSTAIAAYREQLRQELAGLSKRVAPPSGNRISLKGKVFTLPDGSSDKGPFAAVILDWRCVNRYYEGIYNSQSPKPPICWATSKRVDDLAPGDDVKAPKADSCDTCPMNEWGSSPTGKGKACKNTRRLAVVPADATGDTEIMVLDVSPTGLKNFDNYVNSLGAGEHGQLPIEVVTHVGFNPAMDYPTLVFGRPEPITDEQLAVMMHLREKAQVALDAAISSE